MTTHNQTSRVQPAAEHTLARWTTLTTYTQGHDQFPDRVKLYCNGAQIADAPADEYSQAWFAEIVTACNSHAALVAALEDIRESNNPIYIRRAIDAALQSARA